MPTDEVSVSAMHADPRPDLPGFLASGVRGALRRKSPDGRGPARVLGGRRPLTGRYRRTNFEEASLGADTQVPHEAIGCRNLVAAMMEGAIYEFRSVRSASMMRSKQTLEHAQGLALRSWAGRWIFGDGPKPFGFRWCCAILDLDPERVRRALLERLKFRGKYNVKVKAHNS